MTVKPIPWGECSKSSDHIIVSNYGSQGSFKQHGQPSTQPQPSCRAMQKCYLHPRLAVWFHFIHREYFCSSCLQEGKSFCPINRGFTFDIWGKLSSGVLRIRVTQRSCFHAELGTLYRHHLFPQARKYYTYKRKVPSVEKIFHTFPKCMRDTTYRNII